jgi:4-amino-4-deoxy-L-arabinose transferase-like glycosyltransferase
MEVLAPELGEGRSRPASATERGSSAAPHGDGSTRKVRGDIGPLVIIVLGGSLLRLLLWLWFDGGGIHIWDERDYNRLAIALSTHGEFAFEPGTLTSMRPPLYPATVAALYRMFGLESFQAVRLFQAGLSLLTVLLVYRLGRELVSRRAALWLAALYCFYPSLLVYNALLLTEVLFTFLLAAAYCALVVSFKRRLPGLLVIAGGLLGLAALTRSVLWLLPPFLGVFLLLTWKGSVRQRMFASLALLVPFVATITPWTIRNTSLQRTFITIDTMGGRNFMMGNYRFTPLYRSWDAISVKGEESWFSQLCSSHPQAKGSSQGVIDKLALDHGFKFVFENPALTLKRDLVKLLDFWGLERELIAAAGQGFFGPIPIPVFILLTVVVIGSYAAVAILGIFGAVMTPPADRRMHGLFLLVIVFICGMHTIVFGHSRYHLPIIPLVLLYSANAIVNLPAIWKQRSRWSFRLAGGLSGLLVAGWLWTILAVDLQRYLEMVRGTA